MNNLSFSDLIDIEGLQIIASNIYKSSKIPIGIVGKDGELCVSAGWQMICTKYHQSYPESKKNCIILNSTLTEKYFKDDLIDVKCPNGLREVGLAVRIEEELIATVFLGQFAYDYETIDYDYFRNQAREYGFDEYNYIKALDDVPVISKEKVENILDYYRGLILMLVDSGLTKIKYQRAMQEARVSEARLQSFFQAMDDMVFIVDESECYKDFISADNDVLLAQPSEFIGKHIATILPKDLYDKYRIVIQALKDGESFQELEYQLEVNNEQRWFSSKVSKVMNFDGEGYDFIAVVRDITILKKNEELIREMAYYDNLTGLYNRAMFYSRLEEEINRQKRLDSQIAVIFLDLDNFKKINDTRGHQIGDQLLQIISKRLSKTIRNVDVLARMGGDEFTFILSDIEDIEEITKMVKRVIKAINKPIDLEGVKTLVTSSIGIALYPDDGNDSAVVVKNADLAMYKAKEKGKNRYQFYNSVINDELIRRFEVEDSLKAALKNNDLELHYQPILKGPSKEIYGFEALLRWKTDVGNYLPPLMFIPIAEETGMIIPIGLWVLKEACKFNLMIHEKYNIETVISVNLSIIQLNEKNFVNSLIDVLNETGMESKYLALELTESVFIDDFDHAYKKLIEIKELGVKISLDDFGTGYSSLGYVKSLPLDTLKIDRLFIKDICTDESAKNILAIIIELAKRLGLEVVAEGVESGDQVELLLENGDVYMQGYLYYKPMPVNEVENVIQKLVKEKS